MMTDMDRPRRANGWSRPYTPAQLSTWIFLPLLVLEFLFFTSPLLPLAASIPCSILFCGLAAASAYYGTVAMQIDPADPRILQRQNNEDEEQQQQQQQPHGHDSNETTKQCWICDVQVGEKSMHCKFCNKCVDQFDHHCMWLNTCVGKANYPYFFRTMLSITALLIVHFAIPLALVLDIYIGDETHGTKQRAQDWFQVGSELPVVVVMSVFLVVDLGALSLIGQLLMFHLRLRREGLTTYQFIVKDNQRRREQAKMDHELRQTREAAMRRAKEEGRAWDSFRLQCGGALRKGCHLKCCDPLEHPRPTNKSSSVNRNNNKVEVENGNGNGGVSTDVQESKEAENH